jgi:hypothetical protein
MRCESRIFSAKASVKDGEEDTPIKTPRLTVKTARHSPSLFWSIPTHAQPGSDDLNALVNTQPMSVSLVFAAGSGDTILVGSGDTILNY